MKDAILKPNKASIPCLALRARDAAAALSVSERTLWTWANDGVAPHIRLGGTVLFPVDELRRWLTQQTAASAVEGGGHE